MENYKYIDITQLPEDLWQDAKNLIAIDSNGEVIKAAKEDSYTKEEIDELLSNTEVSADNLKDKIKINSASTDYVVTQPTVSGDSLIITDSMSDKNKYHTFGYDKTFTYEGGVYRTDFIFEEQSNKYYSCPDWDVDKNTLTMSVNSESYGQFQFKYFDSNMTPTVLDITISEGSITLSKNAEYPTTSSSFASYYNDILKVSVDGTYISYFPNAFAMGSVSKTFGDNSKIVFILGKLEMPSISIPPQIRTTGEQNILQAPETVTAQTSNYPERLNDYIRYSNDVKAYILTDKNTTFKTINGEEITGSGNIEVAASVDLSNYATKEELNAKQDTLVSGTNIKSINGTSLLSSGNMELATKEELNTKQDVINDLDAIRSGAAKGATALQSVPSEYATEQWVNEQGFLKEHQDISNLATKAELATKQDVLVSGTNIKTINGVTLLGEGNITIEGGGNVDLSDYYTKSETNSLVSPKLSQVTLTQAEYDALSTKENNVLYVISDAANVDPSDYYTKAEIDSMIGGASSTITEINNLVV